MKPPPKLTELKDNQSKFRYLPDGTSFYMQSAKELLEVACLCEDEGKRSRLARLSLICNVFHLEGAIRNLWHNIVQKKDKSTFMRLRNEYENMTFRDQILRAPEFLASPPCTVDTAIAPWMYVDDLKKLRDKCAHPGRLIDKSNVYD